MPHRISRAQANDKFSNVCDHDALVSPLSDVHTLLHVWCAFQVQCFKLREPTAQGTVSHHGTLPGLVDRIGTRSTGSPRGVLQGVGSMLTQALVFTHVHLCFKQPRVSSNLMFQDRD